MNDNYIELGEQLTPEFIKQLTKEQILELFTTAWERVKKPKHLGEYIQFYVDYLEHGAKFVTVSIGFEGFGYHERTPLSRLFTVGVYAEYRAFLHLQRIYSKFKDDLIRELSRGTLALTIGPAELKRGSVLDKFEEDYKKSKHSERS